MTAPDLLVLGLRALAFCTVLHAAGTVFYRLSAQSLLERSDLPLRRLTRRSAAWGMVFSLAYLASEPARLTGDFLAILDLEWHRLLLNSGTGVGHGLRLAGLLLVLLIPGRAIACLGAVLIVGSFTTTGHTATQAGPSPLGIALFAHLNIIAFWYGALLPLRRATGVEPAALTAALIARFSAIAGAVVPLIIVLGLILVWRLVKGWSELYSPWGLLMLVKVLVFGSLMVLAALNRWRLGPVVASGQSATDHAFRRNVLAEWWLITALIAATAVMTALYSPHPD